MGRKPDNQQWVVAVCVVLLLQFCAPLGAETITLKNGMQLEGAVGTIADLKNPVLATVATSGNASNGIQSVVVVDDGLRRTLVPKLQVKVVPGAVERPEIKIKVPQRVAATGMGVNTMGPILRVTPFDEWGRRIFSMTGPRGRIDAVQGITEVTPLYTRVQGLTSSTSYVWDMRIATSSLSRETLSRILRGVDPGSSARRLEIVRLYIQADRIQDARLELEQIQVDFPKMEGLKDQVDSLRQIGAQRLMREIQLRREAGQHVMAYRMAKEFPIERIADATILSIRDINTEYEDQTKEIQASLATLAEQLKAIETPAMATALTPYCQEIAAELNLSTMDRLADFNRLADDKSLTADQKVALAVSGWLLGAGAGTDNTAVAMSLGKVRDLVGEYLRSAKQAQREEILEKLKSLEGGTPAYLAKIVSHMRPPLHGSQDKKADNTQPPGLLTCSVPGVGADAEFEYLVQLPPEYDPYRRYPCIVALHAEGNKAEDQIDWWAGKYSEQITQRAGQATRHGYIVIAPRWTKEFQQRYEHSTREHAAVLFPLRDAMQRFAIDSDRVFLTGHSMGGDAVWDIALAHPDLWAGVMPFTANCEKFVTLYSDNARYVPMYFVVGEKDGKRSPDILTQWDRYMSRAGYDVMIVDYLGRGHEGFYDEIQRIFEWMKLHQRNFFPEKFQVHTVRESDNFFWWVEAQDFPPKTIVAPLAWPPAKNTPPVTIEAKRQTDTNSLTLKCGAKKVRFYLSPDMARFDDKLHVSINSKQKKAPEPSAEVLLEDVRTRGDRRHPFWAVVESP